MSTHFAVKLPSHRITQIFIFCGIPAVNYIHFCRKFNFGNYDVDEYNYLAAEMKKKKIMAQMISKNVQRFKDGKRPVIYKRIRADFQYPKVLDQIVNGLSKSAFANDFSELMLPREIGYFISNTQLRIFIECAILGDLSFFYINRICQSRYSHLLLFEDINSYCYYCWDLKQMDFFDLKLFFKVNSANAFYSMQRNVFSEGASYLKGILGFQDKNHFAQNMMEIYTKVLNLIAKKNFASSELFSLLNLTSPENQKNILASAEYLTRENIGSPKMILDSNDDYRRMNREFRFNELYNKSIGEVNNESKNDCLQEIFGNLDLSRVE